MTIKRLRALSGNVEIRLGVYGTMDVGPTNILGGND